MEKEDVELFFWSHPTIKSNKEILDIYGTPMFKNQKEKDRSIAMFAVDNKFITRQEMYKLFGKVYR